MERFVRAWRRWSLHIPLATSIDDRLKAATIKLVNRATGTTATGVIVSHKGHFVSCCHLFARDADWPERSSDAKAWISERFEAQLADGKHLRFEVIDYGYDRKRYIDFVVGKITSPDTFVSVPVSQCDRISGECRVWGHGEAIGQLTPANCTANGEFDPDANAKTRIFQLDSDQANVGGFSGAGIFSRHAGGIVGIQIRGVDPAVFPQLGTVVLAYATRNIRILTGASLGVGIVARWWLDAMVYRLTNFAKRRAIYLFATLLSALVLFGLFNSYRQQLTDRMLEKSDRASEWSSQESAVFGPDADKYLQKYKQERGHTDMCSALIALLKEQKIMQVARQLSQRFDQIAECARDRHCFSAQICRSQYNKMRKHYNWYSCVFRGPSGALEEESLQNVELLLTKSCPAERAKECTENTEQIVVRQAKVCSDAPESSECSEFPVEKACARFRAWCSDLFPNRVEQRCPARPTKDGKVDARL